MRKMFVLINAHGGKNLVLVNLNLVTGRKVGTKGECLRLKKKMEDMFPECSYSVHELSKEEA